MTPDAIAIHELTLIQYRSGYRGRSLALLCPHWYRRGEQKNRKCAQSCLNRREPRCDCHPLLLIPSNQRMSSEAYMMFPREFAALRDCKNVNGVATARSV